ncbi:hypothetical protein PR048_012288 [Dryococelus australis]|uniref:DDE-1 domain-containing protein n=1 Tax=Dryococelus australis TaxID=614101 RepID=A0ABQ9HNY5_9NEOP|nr:hypothetical protein PR048_012288 [Dryococelus australis]
MKKQGKLSSYGLANRGKREVQFLSQSCKKRHWKVKRISLQVQDGWTGGRSVKNFQQILRLFHNSVRKIKEEGKPSLGQLYNCYKTGPNFEMLPFKSLALDHNGDHKLKLVVRGKSAKTRASKKYNCFCTACYTKGLPSRAILILDNAESHPHEEELKCDLI